MCDFTCIQVTEPIHAYEDTFIRPHKKRDYACGSTQMYLILRPKMQHIRRTKLYIYEKHLSIVGCTHFTQLFSRQLAVCQSNIYIMYRT